MVFLALPVDSTKDTWLQLILPKFVAAEKEKSLVNNLNGVSAPHKTQGEIDLSLDHMYNSLIKSIEELFEYEHLQNG